MRLRLTLRRISKVCNLPINYQSYIAANIYRLIEESSPAYAAFLHNEGYKEKNKRFKHFTFGQLQIPKKLREIERDRILVKADKISLEVSFLATKASENFITGVFQKQTITITDKYAHNEFAIDKIEMIKVAFEEETVILRTLSPLVIGSQGKQETNSTYLSPLDNNYETIFLSNLQSKYQSYVTQISPSTPASNGVTPKFEFLKFNHDKPKLVTIKPKQNIKFKGYLFDFRLTAPIEMIKVGFFGGFGRGCSYGMGMTKLIEKVTSN
ncbi:MAG TPA: CRISPR-associated endoribonuclease Cas6 [Microscillaceae bacterium]|nr:CRISPR-associated endoribonuclease Cas6 [Microscillaceae bacterium]